MVRGKGWIPTIQARVRDKKKTEITLKTNIDKDIQERIEKPHATANYGIIASPTEKADTSNDTPHRQMNRNAAWSAETGLEINEQTCSMASRKGRPPGVMDLGDKF